MSRIKWALASILVAALATFVPGASAAAKGIIVVSGSSAMWQTMALAAFNYNSGTGIGDCAQLKLYGGTTTLTPPCFHWTDGAGTNGKFLLNDTRPGKVSAGRGNTQHVKTISDQGDVWIVWDSSIFPNVLVYIKVDSVVGDKCYFAQPRCYIKTPVPNYLWNSTNSKISQAFWGPDTTPPLAVQNLFTSTNGLQVNTAGTDIRPEDAQFAMCRTNSASGNAPVDSGLDHLDGLGYNNNNLPGVCPQYNILNNAYGQLVGTPVQSASCGNNNPNCTDVANVLAFNVTGKDPFSNLTIPAFSTIDVGADPIVFIYSRANQLAGVTANVVDSDVQGLFSGLGTITFFGCNAGILGGANAGINVFLQEPTSGAMNTAEASVFRHPIHIPPVPLVGSQETGVGAIVLNATPCVGGVGTRSRGIGTGEVVADIKTAGTGTTDGAAYTFFSFGNVSSIGNSPTYGYALLNGQDPIGLGAAFPNQELPLCTVPCPENSAQWAGGWTTGTTFPSLRGGNYEAWSLLRIVTTASNVSGSPFKNVNALVSASHLYVVGQMPDYIPALSTTVTNVGTDPGLVFWHTHYTQFDGAGNVIGVGAAPNETNGNFNAGGNPTGGDAGGDMGGCTISTAGILARTDNGFIQVGPGLTCSAVAVRP